MVAYCEPSQRQADTSAALDGRSDEPIGVGHVPRHGDGGAEAPHPLLRALRRHLGPAEPVGVGPVRAHRPERVPVRARRDGQQGPGYGGRVRRSGPAGAPRARRRPRVPRRGRGGGGQRRVRRGGPAE